MDIKLAYLQDSPLWIELMQKGTIKSSSLGSLIVFKRPNHSMYITYQVSHTYQYVGEYEENTLVWLAHLNPFSDLLPSPLLAYYDFIYLGEGEYYLVVASSRYMNDKDNLFIFKKFDNGLVQFDSLHVTPYHIQDFLNHDIDLTKLSLNK